MQAAPDHLSSVHLQAAQAEKTSQESRVHPGTPRVLGPRLWPAESPHLPSRAPGGLVSRPGPGKTHHAPAPSQPALHSSGFQLLRGCQGPQAPPSLKERPQPWPAIGRSFSAASHILPTTAHSIPITVGETEARRGKGSCAKAVQARNTVGSESWAAQTHSGDLSPAGQAGRLGQGVQIPLGSALSSSLGTPTPLKHNPAWGGRFATLQGTQIPAPSDRGSVWATPPPPGTTAPVLGPSEPSSQIFSMSPAPQRHWAAVAPSPPRPMTRRSLAVKR